MTGYIRQRETDLASSKPILASIFNDEYTAIANAFNVSSGHKHSGSTGEGAITDPNASFVGINANGVVCSNIDTFVIRTLVSSTASITIADGDGISGDPTFSIAGNIAVFEGLSSTGFVANLASVQQRDIDGTAGNIVISDGDGIADNPTIDLVGSIITPDTYDNINSITVDTYGRVTNAATSNPITSGIVLPFAGTSSPTGWVRLNGKTLGNGASSATERANADTQALYELLYANYSDSLLPVIGGRTGNATNDFNAGKPITLPDMRGRNLFGLDDMGNSAASRITNTTASPNGTTLGATGGTETYTMTSTHLPSHHHNYQSADFFITTINSSFGTYGSGVLTAQGAYVFSPQNTDSQGSGGAHDNMMPFISILWIIKL